MDLLRKLTEAFGPSGREDAVAKIIIEEIKEHVDKITIDSLGNVIAFKRGRGNSKLLVSANMDQAAIVVSDIDKKGFARFMTAGDINPMDIGGSEIIFQNGTIGRVSREERIKGESKIENLFIDIGAEDRQTAEKYISVGSIGVIKSCFIVNGSRIMSGALNNRVGCYMAVEAIKCIKNFEPDMYFVFTVQGVTYGSGLSTASYTIKPDSAIIISTPSAGDTPFSNSRGIKLGSGAGIKIMDQEIVYHHDMKEYLKNIADKHNIKYQMDICEKHTAHSRNILTSGSGVITGGISIPIRYNYTSLEVVDAGDIKNSLELLCRAIEEKK